MTIKNDAKVEALRRIVSQIAEERDRLSDADVQAVRSQSYPKSQSLDVTVGVSMKTLSNYINHLTEPQVETLDAPFKRASWRRAGEPK